MLSSSGPKSKSGKQTAGSKHSENLSAVSFAFVARLTYSAVLKMEAVCSSETA
jgi:hypothetical protein